MGGLPAVGDEASWWMEFLHTVQLWGLATVLGGMAVAVVAHGGQVILDILVGGVLADFVVVGDEEYW